jgi:hypothetical protein
MSSQTKSTVSGLEKPEIVRAISIRQPYVEQILTGAKVREYRNVPTNIRERVFIYASKRAGEWFDYDLLGFERDKLPRGLLVGSVDIVGCEWWPRGSCYAYLLENARRLPKPFEPARKPQPIWFRPF